MKRKLFTLQLMVLAAIVLAACSSLGPVATPAAEIEPPNIAGYNKIAGRDLLQQGLTAQSVLSLVFGGNPAFIAAASLIASLGTCASDRGIARFAIYDKQSDTAAAGLILLVSKTKLTDANVLLSCVTPGGFSVDAGEPLDFCQNAYSFSSNGENFWAYYAATKQSVCFDFANTLPPPSP